MGSVLANFLCRTRFVKNQQLLTLYIIIISSPIRELAQESRDANRNYSQLFMPITRYDPEFRCVQQCFRTFLCPMPAQSSPPGVSQSPSSSSSAGCTSLGAPCPPCLQPALQASSQGRSSPGCPRTSTRWEQIFLQYYTATRGRLSALHPVTPNLRQWQRQFCLK